MKNKYIFYFVVLLCFLCTGCLKTEQTSPIEEEVQTIATKGVYLIETEWKMISNDSVGNEWVKSVRCNGEDWEKKKEIIADLNSAITVNASITERDSVPDHGEGDLKLHLEDGFSASETIYVWENRGRYSGNKAQWELKCTVRLLRRI